MLSKLAQSTRLKPQRRADNSYLKFQMEAGMPAYRERVYLCPDQNGQPGWIVEFPVWWDRSKFFERYGARQIDTGNPTYVNYGLLLTRMEARAWDQQCRAAFTGDPRGQQVVVAERMRQWETMLNAASWVIVETYEWESGLE